MRSHGVNWTDRLLGDAFTFEHAVEPRSDPPPITRTSPMSSCAPGVAEARPGLVFAHSGVRLNGLLHYGFCASACRRAPQIECLFVSRGWARGLPRGPVWPPSRGTSRSFVLASLRALHLDLRRRRRRDGSYRGMPSPAPGGAVPGRGATCRVADRGRSVVAGPGSGLSEEPVPGVQSGRAGDRAVPRLPSRAPRAACGAPRVGPEAGEDSIADLPFQRAQGLFGGLALGPFLVEIGAAL